VWTYSGHFETTQEYAPWPFFKHDAARRSKYDPAALVAAGTPVLNLEYGPAGVELFWTVAPGTGNLVGWNVYRAEGERLYVGRGISGVPDGFIKINGDPVAFAGEETAAFVDSTVTPGKVYTYLVEEIRSSGRRFIGPGAVTAGMRGVTIAYLGQNYPNPFGARTTIPYYVEGSGRRITIDIFDAEGRLVRRLKNEVARPGAASVVWDGRDGRGRRAPAGLYFCTLKVGRKIWTRKMMVVK